MIITPDIQKIAPRANLEGASLFGENMRGANLEGANLRGANLEGANLEGANLEGANLFGANLMRANLEGANLKGAILTGARLDGADMRGVNLNGVNLDWVDLAVAITGDPTADERIVSETNMKGKPDENLTCVNCEKNEMAWEWHCETHDYLVRSMNCDVWLNIYHVWENQPCIEFLTAYVKAHEKQLGETWACADIVNKNTNDRKVRSPPTKKPPLILRSWRRHEQRNTG